MKTENILVGEAGEHLACAELLIRGRKATMVYGYAYDILVDNGEGFERIQVKTSQNKSGRWLFAQGGARNRKYGSDVDSYAYVFLRQDACPVVRFWKTPPACSFSVIPE